MKAIKTLIILLFVSFGFSTLNETKAQSVDVAVNFSTFQEDLSPYGTWIDNPRFGQVWVYEDPNFKPYYTDGHWEYTNYGWSWVSDFDWGWAPFHYGRWENDPSIGWMWIPGYEWASAWVSWSSYDDYYGWAPLGFGVGLNISFGSIPYDRWCFVPRRNIYERQVSRYCIPANRNYGFRNAVVINNYYNGRGREGRFFRGPDRSEVQRYTRHRIEERRVTHRGRPENMARNYDRNRNGNEQRRFQNSDNRQDNRVNGQRRFENNNQQGNRNPSNGQDRTERQRRFENTRPGVNDANRNVNPNNGQDRTERQRRFENTRPRVDANQNGNQNNGQDRIERQRRFEPGRQNRVNEQRRPENNRPMERQQNNFPQRQPQENRRQMEPVREQRNQQPQMERRMERRQEPNYNNGNGQGRQRGNDNNQPQRQNRHERRGK